MGRSVRYPTKKRRRKRRDPQGYTRSSPVRIIRPDGTVDMEDHELRQFEFVVASPHSLLRKTVDQTARMVGAVSQPGVCILGHPQGRRFNVRAGVAADWDQVFAMAGRRQVAIEIDGSWDRQDVHYELASRALAHGCVFALDSDAHAHPELDFVDIVVHSYRHRLVNAPGEPRFEFRSVMKRVHAVIAAVAPHDSVARYTRLGVEVLRAGHAAERQAEQPAPRLRRRRRSTTRGASPCS